VDWIVLFLYITFVLYVELAKLGGGNKMKRQTLILVSIFFLLVGCSNNKQSDKNFKNTNIGTVKIGKYFGVPYKLTSSFMPMLTIENSEEFKLELGISKSIEGTYRIGNNKLILTSSDGDENYTLDISNNILVIEQEIPNYVKKSTNFKFSEEE